MIGLDPTTVAVAGQYVAKGLGRSWPADRADVLDAINKIRNKIYNRYPQNNLFSEVFHCICVTEFCDTCAQTCSTGNKYQGFTLPQDVLSVEAVFQSGDPALIRSRWRESRVGKGDHSVRLEVKEMPNLFPTERDIRGTVRLKVFAESADDTGKTVYIETQGADNRPRTLAFTLKGDGWVMVDAYVKSIRSVALPADRKGGVILAEESNYELSIYEPFEVVPAYRRFKISNSCLPTSVLVQGVKRFRDVWWDHDIVEVGDRLVLEAGARYFRYGEGSVDGNEINRANIDLQTMDDEMRGLIARHRGNAVMDGPKTRQCTRRSTLPGYGRR